MKIYFDRCSLQRPLDNRSQFRIAIEAEAILGILFWLSETDTLDLISSDALVFEVESQVGWATYFWCNGTGKRVKPQNTPSPNQLKAPSLNDKGLMPYFF